MLQTPIGSRMKEYEYTSRHLLLQHLPTIVRIDGKTFHTFTKSQNVERPFSQKLHDAMCDTMYHLMTDVMQNAVFGYTQSDEISILLKDWPDLNTQQWFNGCIQKIVSVSASGATAFFNDHFGTSGALFDARVFQLPFNEVTNYFIWRQLDASRNSVQMLGRTYFSHGQLNGLDNSQVQDLLMLHHQVNWNDLETWKKRGSICYKYKVADVEHEMFQVNNEPPIFTQDRSLIDQYVNDQYTPPSLESI